MTGRLPRGALVALLALGLAAALQLALVQLGVIGAWDPLFGDGTTRVLTSAPARALPFPDAALGALVYAAELWLAATSSDSRPRRALVLALLAAAMGLGGIVLISLQAVVVRAFCTLCLVSALVSIVVALAELPVLAAQVRDWRGRGKPANARSQAHPIRSRSLPPR